MLEFIIGYSAGQRTASRAASLARSAAVADGTVHGNRIEDVHERIDRLAMIIRAMWALLEGQGLSAEELIAKMEELDLADGRADGQMTQLPSDCRSCGSKVAAGLAACQFCGAEVDREEHPLEQL